jgi:hypothetical protein
MCGIKTAVDMLQIASFVLSLFKLLQDLRPVCECFIKSVRTGSVKETNEPQSMKVSYGLQDVTLHISYSL